MYGLTPDKFHKAVVELPYNCIVGCSTCSVVCPTLAISFPSRDLVWKAEREHKIFKMVHKEATDKRTKQEIARERAEEQIGKLQTWAQVEIAGALGEKALLSTFASLLKDQPFDIGNLRSEVATVKGLREGAPA